MLMGVAYPLQIVEASVVRDPQHDVANYSVAMPSAANILIDGHRHLSETTMDEGALPFWR
jgi:hypothetical protein